MIQPEQWVEGAWAEWYRLTAVQRWLESEKLWRTCPALRGALDPEPDTQSPFFDPKEAVPISAKQRMIEARMRRPRHG